VSLDGAPADAQLLQRMADRLAFRGPDGTHITTKPGAGFCFTFLRTGPAPQCPSQPCSLDGRVWLLGDVRLDGRNDLRCKLEQHGDEFDGEVTDEELVLRTWRRWGEEGLPDLLGDYAFALWDAEERKLWCARDLMGARPFFYTQAGSRLYFSNTLDAIRCAPDISRELDQHFIGDFLLEGWCSYPERTAFREVRRLQAGYRLRWSRSGLDVRRCASLSIEAPLLKREEEYVERFRELVETATRERLPRGRAAILMSGGLDSTTVAAVAVRCARKARLPLDLRAFTVEYRPLFDDQEGVLATLAARHIGIAIEVDSGASHFPYARWDSAPPPLPEPVHEPFQSLYVEQNQRVAQHSRVALNGFGGDGTLTGQAWPYLIDLARKHQFAKICSVFGAYVIKHRRIPPLRAGFRERIRQVVGQTDPMAAYPRWLAPEFESDMQLRERWRELLPPPESAHPWHTKAHAMLSGSYWPSVLEIYDAARSGAALESRAPLLDLRVQRFLLQVPPVPLCINKELVRRMALGLLPERIRLRPKTPFEGDQVALQASTYGWSPMPLPEPPKDLRQFVNWEGLARTLKDQAICFPWSDLRPISLLYWIRGVENDR
jgi:asparagine synthase (glutamine-hydrolysing)